jgi:hypothetical protein
MVQIVYKIKLDLVPIRTVTRSRNGRLEVDFWWRQIIFSSPKFFHIGPEKKKQVYLLGSLAGVKKPRGEADHHHLVYYGIFLNSLSPLPLHLKTAVIFILKGEF